MPQLSQWFNFFLCKHNLIYFSADFGDIKTDNYYEVTDGRRIRSGRNIIFMARCWKVMFSVVSVYHSVNITQDALDLTVQERPPAPWTSDLGPPPPPHAR